MGQKYGCNCANNPDIKSEIPVSTVIQALLTNNECENNEINENKKDLILVSKAIKDKNNLNPDGNYYILYINHITKLQSTFKSFLFRKYFCSIRKEIMLLHYTNNRRHLYSLVNERVIIAEKNNHVFDLDLIKHSYRNEYLHKLYYNEELKRKSCFNWNIKNKNSNDIDINQNSVNKEAIENFSRYCNLKLKVDLINYCNNTSYSGEVDINNAPFGIGELYISKNESAKNNDYNSKTNVIFSFNSPLIKGSKYQGEFINNKILGYGRLIDNEGSIYEGFFLPELLIHGFGLKIKLNKNKYIGFFNKGKKEGFGKEETPEHTYEGDFFKDRKSGKGRIMYKFKNDSYNGEFYQGNINGLGEYRWNNGNIYIGSFLNGKMHGKGLYKWPDGSYYEGEYKNNLKEGFGVFRWKCGKIYEGNFMNGNPHGVGNIILKNNKLVEVEFKDGKLVHCINVFNDEIQNNIFK